MADAHGKQPIRTLNDVGGAADVVIGVLDDADNRIDPRDVRALTGSDLVTAANPVGTIADLNATVAGTVTVEQATAADLNATVVGTVTAEQAVAGDLNATVTGTLTVQNTTTPSLLKSEVSGAVLDDILAAIGGSALNTAVHLKATLAAGATDANLTVTATGGVLVLTNVVCASTAAARYEVKVDGAIKWVGFTSESTPSIIIDCGGFEVPITKIVLVTMKNLDNQTLDLYGSINYYQK